MADFFALGRWAWIIAGLVLIAIEVLAPGAFMLWLGLAAVATGLVSFGWTLSLEAGSLVFAGFAVVSVLIGRKLTIDRKAAKGEAVLNDRGRALVGRVFVLEQPIAEGRGRVRVDDTLWRVEGPDLPAGSEVRVTGVEGTLLKVAASR